MTRLFLGQPRLHRVCQKSVEASAICALITASLSLKPDHLFHVGDILGSAWELGLVGTYAQTELGHGTFIRYQDFSLPKYNYLQLCL